MGVCTRSQRLYQNYWAKFARDLCACRNAENGEIRLRQYGK